MENKYENHSRTIRRVYLHDFQMKRNFCFYLLVSKWKYLTKSFKWVWLMKMQVHDGTWQRFLKCKRLLKMELKFGNRELI